MRERSLAQLVEHTLRAYYCCHTGNSCNSAILSLILPAEPKLELKCFVVGKGGNKTCKQKAIDSAYHVELLKNRTNTHTGTSAALSASEKSW